MSNLKKTKSKKKKFRTCEVCGEEVPREKFPKHQYYLAGVAAVLCRDMPKAKRRAYEVLSKRRIKKYKAQARSLGLREPLELESYMRGLGLGLGTLRTKNNIQLWDAPKKEEERK